MANVLTEGTWNINGVLNKWRCQCENGQVLYSETNPPNPCNYCGDSSTAPSTRPNVRGFRNMTGSGFSAKNFLVFAAIGAAAYFAYCKFVKK
jgi:ribosomal protein S27E